MSQQTADIPRGRLFHAEGTANSEALRLSMFGNLTEWQE
jgi:hypothetical protein